MTAWNEWLSTWNLAPICAGCNPANAYCREVELLLIFLMAAREFFAMSFEDVLKGLVEHSFFLRGTSAAFEQSDLSGIQSELRKLIPKVQVKVNKALAKQEEKMAEKDAEENAERR